MNTTATIFTKMVIKISLLFLVSILSMNLFCQINWTKHPDNPVMTPGSAGEWDEAGIFYPRVIYYDGTYHMWYSGSRTDSTRIGHATSPDGITWTKDTNNPVLDVGPEGAWDCQNVYAGSVLLIDSVFHMWYNGQATSFGVDNNKIGHATSADGISWTKDPNNPVLTTGPSGTWDETWSVYPIVVHTDGTFHMWYGGFDGTTGIRMGHATSPDGVAWTKDPLNPVMTASGDWEVPLVFPGGTLFEGSTYHMWYQGGKAWETMIGYATSEDGSQWEKYGQPVLEKGPAVSWESQWIGGASVLFDSTKNAYKMWYTGSSTSGFEGGSIGYAELIIETLAEGPATPEIFIYPNPINSFLTIDIGIRDLFDINITSINGKQIHSQNMEGTTHYIDLSSFQKGVYFITIRSEDFVTTRKIIKM